VSKVKKKLSLSKHKLEKDFNDMVKYLEGTDEYKDLLNLIKDKKELEAKIDTYLDNITDKKYDLLIKASEHNPVLSPKVDQYNKYQDHDKHLNTIPDFLRSIGKDKIEAGPAHWKIGSAVPSGRSNGSFLGRLFRFGHLILEAMEGLFNGK
jgi:hypothetical protein